MKIKSEQEMLRFGEEFAKKLREPRGEAIIIELIGDVGTGKTTFTRGLAKGLGVKSAITSPSFTISKSYALPNGGTLSHFDFYRLNDPGLMADDLKDQIENKQNIVVIEWGESIADFLPKNHFKIEITYNDDGSREVKA